MPMQEFDSMGDERVNVVINPVRPGLLGTCELKLFCSHKFFAKRADRKTEWKQDLIIDPKTIDVCLLHFLPAHQSISHHWTGKERERERERRVIITAYTVNLRL
eukprot:TRINITY_DN50155_c0_g1_i13.p1 TRINITY_DN50155_c0_g1~~TRINITY_DN50155_c0_g1_i13.p1  ORF type:complete len:104 (+),score=21.58 TRINITY_DN50155_c0_g1_i13:319-630(+)